jgi:hypothetical protein
MKKLINICDREIRVEGRILRIARPHGDRYRFMNDPAPVIAGLRASGVRVDLFSFAQRLPENQPKFPYSFEWDNFAVIPISTYENWWTHQVGAKTRNLVRLAEKKSVVLCEMPVEETLFTGIREIYNECPIRQRRPFPHYGKSLERVRLEESTFLESSIFIGAFYEGKLIGFVKLVHDETCVQAGLMNIISMVKHRDKAPQNALIACAVRACADRGIRYLMYSKFDYGKGKQDGLRKFKEHNGFQRIDTPRYYVPLTTMGWAALHLGLHHSMSEHLPEPVAKRLRVLRAVWYERRYRSGMAEI